MVADAGANAAAPQAAGALQGGVQRLDGSPLIRDLKNPLTFVVADSALLAPTLGDSGAAASLLGGPQLQAAGGSSSSANAETKAHRDLMNQMDELRDTMREQGTFEASTVAASAAASIGLSVGYVVWLLRGGVLLSTVLYSLPAWRNLDPLPVLERGGEDGEDENEDDDGEQADDSLESLVARNNNTVDNVESERAAAEAAEAQAK